MAAKRSSPERELVTPEGVDLRVRLGQASQRAGAFLIDVAILVTALIALTLLAGAAGSLTKMQHGEFIAVIWLVGAFLLRNAYFISFELGPRAATPGKRMMGLRVAARDGGRLTANAIFARNAMRELEFYLPLSFIFSRIGEGGADSWVYLLGIVWSGIFVLFPLFNRDRLRAGDLVAGTWVVQAPRQKLLVDLAHDGAERLSRFAFTDEQLKAYGVKELHVLEQVLRMKDRRTMTAVANRIRRKIDWTVGPDEYDEDFLVAYYAGLRGRLEGRLLFGHRRLDKLDAA
jgi:uncharacterized RDD family membrane protein YckC